MQEARKPELALLIDLGHRSRFLDVEGGGRQRSDEELVIAARGGDSGALGELFGRHQDKLHNFALRYAANADEARDLVQETMLRAFRNIGGFRGECRFASWLTSILINVALAGKRREKLVRWVYLDETKGEETRFSIRSVRDRSRTPEEDYSHRELRRLLRRKALRLHPKYRMIFKACVLDEASIEQAARSLGITPSAAKARLHRVRQSLSAAMKKPNGQRGYL